MLAELSGTAGRSCTAERLSVTGAKRACGSTKAMSRECQGKREGSPAHAHKAPSASGHKELTPTGLLKGAPLGKAAQKRLSAFPPSQRWVGVP